jgi:hypothetical protein
MNADTRPGARPRTPLAAALLIPSPWTRPPIPAGRPGLATVHPIGYPSLRTSWCKKRAGKGVEELGAARQACTHRCGTTTWAPSNAKGESCFVCGVVGSGLSHQELPLQGVRAQRCGHLVPFRTKSRPRPRCGSPVPDMSRNKRGYLQDLPMRATAAFQGAAKKGVSVACVLVFVMHACLCLCRLLQRGQHDAACLLVFVMHACS